MQTMLKREESCLSSNNKCLYINFSYRLAEFVRNMDIVELYSGQNIINEYFIRTLAGGETRELNSDDPMNTDQGSEDRNPVEKLVSF